MVYSLIEESGSMLIDDSQSNASQRQTPESADEKDLKPLYIRRCLLIPLLVCSCLVNVICSTLLITGAGFLHAAATPLTTGGTVPKVALKTDIKSFHLDRDFAAIPPQDGPEPLWDSLLPNGLGYVNGFSASSDLSVITVFHQLHCLYTLRRAYFALEDGAVEAQEFDFGHNRTTHVRHCFEYLRQGLMCSADSSIEPAGGVARNDHEFIGWGFPRQCHSYDQLKDWAERHRAFDGYGFMPTELHLGTVLTEA